jgi:hypothetical protein
MAAGQLTAFQTAFLACACSGSIARPSPRTSGRPCTGTCNPHTGLRRIDEAFPHELRANTLDERDADPLQERLGLAGDRLRQLVNSGALTISPSRPWVAL